MSDVPNSVDHRLFIGVERLQIEALLDRGSNTTDPSRAPTPTSGPSTPHIPRFREGSTTLRSHHRRGGRE